jgi:HEAT repeat protein
LKKIPPHRADVDLLRETAKDADEAIEVRLQAVKSLGMLGDPAGPAVDQLFEEIKDAEPALRKEMFIALVAIGPEPKHIKLLAESLKATDPEMRRLAGEGLMKLGPHAKPALRDLIAALKNADKTTRLVAVRAIDAIGSEGKDAAPSLMVALKDSEPAVGIVAAEALIKLGEGQEVVPFLGDTVKSAIFDLRKQACQALAGLGNQVKGKAGRVAVEELIGALDDVPLRPEAADALYKIGGFAADIIATSVAKAKVLKTESRRECIRLLGRIGHSSVAVRRTLQLIIGSANNSGDPDEENRRIAQQVMLHLGKTSQPRQTTPVYPGY